MQLLRIHHDFALSYAVQSRILDTVDSGSSPNITTAISFRNGPAFVCAALLYEAGAAIPAKLLYVPPMPTVAESVLERRAEIRWVGAF